MLSSTVASTASRIVEVPANSVSREHDGGEAPGAELAHEQHGRPAQTSFLQRQRNRRHAHDCQTQHGCRSKRSQGPARLVLGDVEPVLDRTKHGRYLALLSLQAPYHATLIPHLKLIVAQLGFGQPGGVYGRSVLTTSRSTASTR